MKRLLIIFVFAIHATSALSHASGNFSGYEQSRGSYTSVSATWRVPHVKFGMRDTLINAMAEWVGIDDNDGNIVQCGTTADIKLNGQIEYGAYYELLPVGARYISQTVKPGDIINASVVCASNCGRFDQGGQQWTLTVRNVTRGWTFSTALTKAMNGDTAEIILEDPTGGDGTLYGFPDYGVSQVSNVRFNGVNPDFQFPADEIHLRHFGRSDVSLAAGGDSFNFCYGAGKVRPVCPAARSADAQKP